MVIITSEIELEQRLSTWKQEKKSIVTTNGAFDLLHPGHINSLQFAKKQGDILIVLLNSDTSIQSYKSTTRPIIHEKGRITMVNSLSMVDAVMLFNDKDPIRLLSIIKPDIHVKGSEYQNKLIEKEVVEQNGGQIVFLNRTDDWSTSGIISKIISIYGDQHV